MTTPLDPQTCGTFVRKARYGTASTVATPYSEELRVTCAGCGHAARGRPLDEFVLHDALRARACPQPLYGDPAARTLLDLAWYAAAGIQPPMAWAVARGVTGSLTGALRGAWDACDAALPMGQLLAVLWRGGTGPARFQKASAWRHGDEVDVKLEGRIAVTLTADEGAELAAELRHYVTGAMVADAWDHAATRW